MDTFLWSTGLVYAHSKSLFHDEKVELEQNYEWPSHCILHSSWLFVLQSMQYLFHISVFALDREDFLWKDMKVRI